MVKRGADDLLHTPKSPLKRGIFLSMRLMTEHVSGCAREVPPVAGMRGIWVFDPVTLGRSDKRFCINNAQLQTKKLYMPTQAWAWHPRKESPDFTSGATIIPVYAGTSARGGEGLGGWYLAGFGGKCR